MVTPVMCQICKQPVILETARVDEHGKAVHEECYFNALKGLQRPSIENGPDGDGERG